MGKAVNTKKTASGQILKFKYIPYNDQSRMHILILLIKVHRLVYKRQFNAVNFQVNPIRTRRKEKFSNMQDNIDIFDLFAIQFTITSQVLLGCQDILKKHPQYYLVIVKIDSSSIIESSLIFKRSGLPKFLGRVNHIPTF